METKTALLIDSNLIDIFINRKILEHYGITHIRCERNCNDALSHLQKISIKYDIILTDIYLPLTNGFEFIDKFTQLGLNKRHGEVFILSSSINPLDKEKAEQRKIKFIEKPLSIENLALLSHL